MAIMPPGNQPVYASASAMRTCRTYLTQPKTRVLNPFHKRHVVSIQLSPTSVIHVRAVG
jgi:hypothetical protein